MIEPIRGQLDAYDISCSACGIVERFENLRLAPHILRPKLAAKGWRTRDWLFYCRECGCPAPPRTTRQRETTRLSASDKDLERLFGIELVAAGERCDACP